MLNLYNKNGLIFWSSRQVRLRRMLETYFTAEITDILTKTNSAWRVFQIEAPILTPQEHINPEYSKDYTYTVNGSDLVLRPETTAGTYCFALHIIESHNKIRLPFCLWQSGRSFRKEQDQVTKNIRLKEFHQQEFQCFYTRDTKNDYLKVVAPQVQEVIGGIINLPNRLVKSSRLPTYSEITLDVEVNNGDKWMEVCSMSRRTDFGDLLVMEIAIGLDRCVYNFER